MPSGIHYGIAYALAFASGRVVLGADATQQRAGEFRLFGCAFHSLCSAHTIVNRREIESIIADICVTFQPF